MVLFLFSSLFWASHQIWQWEKELKSLQDVKFRTVSVRASESSRERYYEQYGDRAGTLCVFKCILSFWASSWLSCLSVGAVRVSCATLQIRNITYPILFTNIILLVQYELALSFFQIILGTSRSVASEVRRDKIKRLTLSSLLKVFISSWSICWSLESLLQDR